MATAIDDRQELLEQFQAVSIIGILDEKFVFLGSRALFSPHFSAATPRGFLSIGFISVETYLSSRLRPKIHSLEWISVSLINQDKEIFVSSVLIGGLNATLQKVNFGTVLSAWKPTCSLGYVPKFTP